MSSFGGETINNRDLRRNLVAVAVDKGSRGSREALRWIIDHHVIAKGQCVMLVHVINLTTALNLPLYEDNGFGIRRKLDEAVMDVFTPFACFCKLRQVECEVVILQHANVAQALREFILFYGVHTFVLGGVKKHPFIRIIRREDIQTNLEKYAPSFCSIYGIYNGMIMNSKSKVCPVWPPYYIVAEEETVPSECADVHELEPSESVSLTESSSASSAPLSAPVSRISSTTQPDEFSFREVDSSRGTSERPNSDSTFLSFYKSLGPINWGHSS